MRPILPHLSLCLALAGSLACGGHASTTSPAASSVAPAPYLGETQPGLTPLPFAPAAFKTLSAWVESVAFTPDGRQCFVTVGTPDYSGGAMWQATFAGGAWADFKLSPLATGFSYSGEPVVSPDGLTLTFSGRKPNGNIDPWRATRSSQDGTWSEPVAMTAPIASASDEFRGSWTTDGTFYFGRVTAGAMAVHRALKDATGQMTVEKLGAPFNGSPYDGDPCVAPDGRWVVFYSGRQKNGSTDLYVTFRTAQGGWTDAQNLGAAFNTRDDEYGACLSPDGKFLFFTRHGAQGNTLHWVSVAAIDRLKP